MRSRLVARLQHLAQQPLQVDRLRRRVRRRALLTADDPFDGADEPGAGRPAASSIERIRYVVVVLPLVPVTPASCRRSLGRPKNASAATAIEARTSSTRSCGTATSSGRSTTSAAAPAATASAASSCPSTLAPGTQKNSAPLRHPPCVVGEVGDLDRPPPDHVVRRQPRGSARRAPSAAHCRGRMC